MSPSDRSEATLHASCVAWDGRAVLILGPSGSGKSRLALQLMAYGAELVADDRTCVTRRGDELLARAPAPIHGLIEARGIGLLKADAATAASVICAVDLAQAARERLPQLRDLNLLGHLVTLIPGGENDHLGPALLQLLKKGLDRSR
ncbi:HPr kinase/phosphorylase [Profundibacterium mesophilum]|uniref:HPr Serine kinase C-terminal domain containing protein n=1 Tax=Profundibacterium mesophilum KAUST100406-0324 TaxID=1037889 RepID=A0A921TBG1_9RHOB|nr:HPr kinase/phosphatase C-terminal domain-containing protein [Profundibacterium mesophilum]KAF0675555.1 HPr Serine kinase C-terminal domain containing protein [Profundibacterium mesophilum KAUST100406-0324]